MDRRKGEGALEGKSHPAAQQPISGSESFGARGRQRSHRVKNHRNNQQHETTEVILCDPPVARETHSGHDTSNPTMIQLGLRRATQLCRDVPQPWLAAHIAGTNGKGSICHYLSHMLHDSGVRCGRFTSPHLIDR
jgi:UDP-N-acetylmuramoylalanine-D-glutamate ligase